MNEKSVILPIVPKLSEFCEGRGILIPNIIWIEILAIAAGGVTWALYETPFFWMSVYFSGLVILFAILALAALLAVVRLRKVLLTRFGNSKMVVSEIGVVFVAMREEVSIPWSAFHTFKETKNTIVVSDREHGKLIMNSGKLLEARIYSKIVAALGKEKLLRA